ncbi:MAG: protein jag [Clostridiales bacterium]|nr:protein jag [Clostridiales bacterium]
MEYREFVGKTVEEAIEKGLAELNIAREDADIRILEEGKKKLFGSVKAKVEIGVIEKVETAPEASATEEGTDGERAVAFLGGLFEILKIEAVAGLVSEGDKIEINVTAANSQSVIGKHGAMLDAIQTLAGAVANKGRDDYKRVVVDCENYRDNREATLNRLAENLAAKAIRLGRKIKLEAMNPYERRIIHAALSAYEGVKTESEGKEPNRYVVIVPANLEDETAPAIPARVEKRDDRRGGRRDDRRGGRRDDRKGGYGGKKPYSRDRKPAGSASSGGTTMKKSSDFFGTFLGNSKDM